MADPRLPVVRWRKSSHSSDPDLACCVEVGALDDARAIRDSKNPHGPRLSLSIPAWRNLVTAIKADTFQG